MTKSAQSLGALLVDIGRLSTTLSGGHPEVKAQLDNLKSVAERTFQTVRNIALLAPPFHARRPWVGGGPGMGKGREVSRRSEVEVSVESENVPEDLPEFEYKILHLPARPGSPEQRRAPLRRQETRKSWWSGWKSRSLVRVIDDGRGFDPGRSRGMGNIGNG